MPHIAESERGKYKIVIDNLPIIETKGDLEYCVFRIMKKFMSTRKICYTNLHDSVYGVIHSAEEYKRLYLDKREELAIAKNGEA